MGTNTVARSARATAPEDLCRGQWQNRPTKLDEDKPYLHERRAAGYTNTWTLWQETKGKRLPCGYGARPRPLSAVALEPAAGRRAPSTRTIAG